MEGSKNENEINVKEREGGIMKNKKKKGVKDIKN
jgi:hypothetical protein